MRPVYSPTCASLLNFYYPLRALQHPTAMRNAAWIWFAGTAAWIIDAIVSLRLHSTQHAQLAFLVAMVFFAAGIFYRRQSR